jgi:photosystem II stability/assembly factor-like uncharacterized protein
MKKAPWFAIASLVCFITSAQAQTPLWVQTNGPSGRWISAINFDSSGNVYVIADNLYRSGNDGATWQILPQAPITLSTLSNGDLMGTFKSSLAISKDHGGSWTTVISFSQPSIPTLNLGSANPNIATGNINGDIFVETPSGNFLRSTNEGANWDTLPPAPFQGVLHSYSTTTLFTFGGLFSENYLAYRSTDLGNSWSKIINGNTDFWSMAGQAGGQMFGIAGAGSSDHPDFWSTDDGRTWTQTTKGTGTLVAFGKNGPNAFFWSGLGIDIFNESNTYIHTVSTGIFSPDAEAAGAFPTDMESSPSGEVWVASGPTLFKINPVSDKAFTNVPLPTGGVNFLVSNGVGNLIAVAGIPSGGSLSTFAGGQDILMLYNSSDTGQTWNGIQASDNFQPIISPLATDSSKRLLGGNTFTSRNNGVMVSVDGGTTWSQLGPQLTTTPITSIVVGPNGNIYMGCAEGVFRSTDNGNTWDQLNSGITNQQIQSIAVSQTGEIFVGTSTAIFHSTDLAINWEALPFTPPDTSGIISLTINTAGDLLAAVHDKGIFWSHDDGKTWSPIGTGLNGTVNAMLSTPSGHVFAGTTSGVFYLPSGGGSWIDATSGLGSISVLSITRDPNGMVYLGTDGSGVFRSTQLYNSIKSASSVSQPNAISENVSLGQVYPNPLQSSGTFIFTIPEASRVRVALLNTLGEQVQLITDGPFEAGSFQLGMDAHQLPIGIYYLMLIAGDVVKAEKVVIAR